MIQTAEMVAVVRGAIMETWPGRFSREELLDDVALGDDGLGLDSVEIVEVLFACEQQCGVRCDEELFAAVLTINRLAEHLAR